MTIDENRAREVEKLIAFQEEAARHFEKRPTGGEDAAYWSNIYNAENCRKTVAALRALAASPTPPAPLRADAGEVERLREAYNAVAYWPEKRGDPMTVGGQGFIDLLALRNLVGEMLPALTARQDAATDAGVERALSVIETYKRASSHPYAQKVAQAIHDAVSALITPKPGASQGEALATQENNHAG
jgi:hypothetical protein